MAKVNQPNTSDAGAGDASKAENHGPVDASEQRYAALEDKYQSLLEANKALNEEVSTLRGQVSKLSEKLVKNQPENETVVKVSTAFIPVRDHGLPPRATAEEIAKALKATGKGIDLATVKNQLAAAVRENPNICQKGKYSIYGMTLWRYLGYQFVQPSDK